MSFQDYRHGSTNSSTAGGARGAYNSNKPASSRGGLGGGDWGDAAGRQRPSSGGFGSAGPLRTGGVGVGVGSRPISGGGALHHGGVGAGGVGVGSGGASGGGKVGDYLMGYSQNISILNRMVQQLGTARDTSELRGQCRCQLEVVSELQGKIQAELRQQQQTAEGASRQDAARIGAMNAKLTKDFNRVKAVAAELATQAERRMREVDAQRQRQQEEDEARANQAFTGAEGQRSRQGMMVSAEQQRERIQMQEEAVNTAIIQETEEELQQINKSLYKVNEIYRDLASIVEQQSEAVEQIETNTEGAHSRAQEGLVQVQKANSYQPTCTIS